ncbi:MAG TPA: hypothetical protein VL990_03340 [Acidobacteriaceae bacterium]|nr:hypothetical protein [Acidobacteriaceae bacterium]
MPQPQPCAAIAIEIGRIIAAIERISSSTLLPGLKGSMLATLYQDLERLIREYEACIKDSGKR